MSKFSEKEIDELRKSLTTLGFSEEEITDFISKSVKEDDSGEQETIEDMASEGKENKTGEEKEEDEEETEEIKKGKMKSEYEVLKARMCEIEKSMPELKEETKEEKAEDIKKSLEDEFNLNIESLTDNIEKSITDRLSEIREEYDEIIKGLKDELKKIGDTPLGMKSTFTKANFFEKSTDVDINENGGPKVLSISKDRDLLIKSMEDSLNSEKDPDIKAMLLEGISDYTVNHKPNAHGARALAYLSRNKNITLEQ